MTVPTILVTFYDNCRQEPVDVSGVKQGLFESGDGTRTWHVKELIHEMHPDPENPFFCLAEQIDENIFDEVRATHYAAIRVQIVASGGTWKIKARVGGEASPGGGPFETGPIAHNATAAEIQAMMPALAQPVGFNREKNVFLGDGGKCSGGPTLEEFAPEIWIEVIELGPSDYEFRFFAQGGATQPNPLEFTGINIDLGPVFELFWFHDEVQYGVPLTRGLFGGGKAERGEVTPQGGAGGSRASPRPVSGSRA